MSNKRTYLVAISLSIGACLFGGADFIDFRADRTAEGWSLGETEFNGDRGRKFVHDGDAITSPAAASAVTSATVIVSVTGNNAPPPRFHVLVGSSDDDLHEIGMLTNRVINIFTTNRFTFAESDQVKKLRIAVDYNSNTNKNTRPYVVGAGFGEIPVPTPPPVLQAPEPLSVSSVVAAGVWCETFDRFTELFPSTGNTSVWTNGVTLTPWQAFEDGAPPTTLTRNQGAKNTGGLYTYWIDKLHPDSYTLGMNVASDVKTAVWGVAFTNDTRLTLKDFALAFTGRQFGFKNTTNQTVAVEWLVTNCLTSIATAGAWHRESNLTYTTPAVAADAVSMTNAPLASLCSGPLAELRLGPGQLLLLRWRRDRVTNSAAVGIDDVNLTWRATREPTIIILH